MWEHMSFSLLFRGRKWKINFLSFAKACDNDIKLICGVLFKVFVVWWPSSNQKLHNSNHINFPRHSMSFSLKKHGNYQFHADIHHNGVNQPFFHHVICIHPEWSDAHQRVKSWSNFFRSNGRQLLRFPQLAHKNSSNMTRELKFNQNIQKICCSEAFSPVEGNLSPVCWEKWTKAAQDVACKVWERESEQNRKIFHNWNKIEMLSHVVMLEDYCRLFVWLRSNCCGWEFYLWMAESKAGAWK